MPPDSLKKKQKKYVDYINKHINFDRKHYELAEITITNCADDKVDIDWKVKGTKPYNRVSDRRFEKLE